MGDDVTFVPAHELTEGDTIAWDAQLKWPLLITRIERHDDGRITFSGITELSSTVYDPDHEVRRLASSADSTEGEGQG